MIVEKGCFERQGCSPEETKLSFSRSETGSDSNCCFSSVHSFVIAA